MFVFLKFIILNYFVYKNYYINIIMKVLYCIFMYCLIVNCEKVLLNDYILYIFIFSVCILVL